MKHLILSILALTFFGCHKSEKYKSELNSSNHPTTILKAAYELGELKDTSAIRSLLENILDPRMSTNMNFKGMTVCYGKLVALNKIANIKPPKKISQFEVDTSVVLFYLQWAVDNKFIKSFKDVEIQMP